MFVSLNVTLKDCSFVLPVVVYMRAGLAALQRQSIVGEVASSLLNSVISACKPDSSDCYYNFHSRRPSLRQQHSQQVFSVITGTGK